MDLFQTNVPDSLKIQLLLSGPPGVRPKIKQYASDR